MRDLNRAGFTLPEMLVSLAVMGIVVALASHAAVGQLRFFRGVGEVVAVRTQTGHASAVARRVVWGVSAGAGDIVVAEDSVLEIHATIGSAVVCADGTGAVTIPAPAARTGNALTAFTHVPRFGDRVHLFFADSFGAGWLAGRVWSVVHGGASCDAFAGAPDTWTLQLAEPLAIPAGAALRFTRPLRLSAYRASDTHWYLGIRDWNGERFNTIQPVAGPLEPLSADAARTGLRFVYHDAWGGELLPGTLSRDRIATITIVTRGKSLRAARVAGMSTPFAPFHLDSALATFALRDAPSNPAPRCPSFSIPMSRAARWRLAEPM
ncbi:MAG: prepilin-type N-terminal cleavage/methylation domain-containing protein [Gemmatimonadaceae bacterium]